jgi:hypothetical protein
LTLFLSLTFLIFGVYGLIFTSFGNSITKPFVESYLQSNIDKDVKLNKFSLSFNYFDVSLNLQDTTISSRGKYDLFGKYIEATYSVDIKDLSKFEKITKQDLRGAFALNGTIIGNIRELKIVANSNIFDSKTKVELDLVKLKPQILYYTIENAKVEKILYMLKKPIYLVGLINSDGKLDSLDLENLSGIASVSLEEGLINKKELQNYDINITDVRIGSSTYIELNKDKVSFQSKTLSSLANLYLKKGVYNTTTKELSFDSLVEVDNIDKFSNYTKVPINSPLIIVSKDTYIKDFDKNTLKTDTKVSLPIFVPDLASFEIEYPLDKPLDIASSIKINEKKASFDTNIKSQLLDFRLYDTTIDLSTNDAVFRYSLDIPELLEIQNIIKNNIGGKVSIKSEKSSIKNFDINTLSSSQTIELSEIIPDLSQKDIEYPQDRPIDILSTITTSDGMASIDLEAFSKIFVFSMPKGVYDIKNKKLIGDYKLSIEDLGELKPFANRDLRGELDIKGAISYQYKLKLTADFDIANGKSSLVVDGDNVYMKANSISAIKLTHMLYYPEVFDSLCELNLNHNLATEKGVLSVKLTEGKFVPTTMTKLIETFTRFDITGEFYQYVNIDTNIDKDILKSNIDAVSQNTKIYAKDALIDKKEEKIDAKLNVIIKDKPLAVSLKGSIKSPKVNIDAKDWIKQKLSKEVDKQIEKHQDKIDKVVPKELQEPIKNIFKNLF